MMNRGPTSSRARRGFTLIEVLVALTLGVLLLLVLTTIFARNSGNQSELERNTRQLENARFALDMISEDLMHAGYFGEFDPDPLVVNAAVDNTMPDPCATAASPASTQGWNTPNPPNPLSATAADRVWIPVAVQGVAAGANPSANVNCLPNRLAGTEAVIVRHAETGAPTTIAAAVNTNLYIQIARCSLDTSRIRAAAGGSASLNLRLPDCATVNDELRRLTQRTYYVAACNDCAANDGIPTLKRVEVINGVQRTMPVAEGVENLQVEYGLDTNTDGRPDAFVTMGSGTIAGTTPAGTTPPNAWQNVVAVRLHLLTRSSQPTPGYVDVRTYRMGPDVTVTPPADASKRTLLTTTVRLNNVGGRRD
jgi:type IV pilus assembly protein PilW